MGDTCLVFILSPPHFLSNLAQTLKRSAVPVWAHPVGEQRAPYQGGIDFKLNLLLLLYAAWRLGKRLLLSDEAKDRIVFKGGWS